MVGVGPSGWRGKTKVMGKYACMYDFFISCSVDERVNNTVYRPQKRKKERERLH